jgi:hypothetical protein
LEVVVVAALRVEAVDPLAVDLLVVADLLAGDHLVLRQSPDYLLETLIAIWA